MFPNVYPGMVICACRQRIRVLSIIRVIRRQGFAERVFHLHLRLLGDNDELYFRDYLLAHPDIAQAYERLKLSLWKQYEYDRDSYTEAKTDFIRRYTELAKKEFKDKYQRVKS